MRNIKTGRKVSDETKMKISKANTGKSHRMSQDLKEKLKCVNCKQVALIENGNIIRTFQSVTDAAVYIKNTFNKKSSLSSIISNIGSVAGNKKYKGLDGVYRNRKKAYGYHWKFI